jgi:hypothetical protein
MGTKKISLTIPEESAFTHVLFNLAAQGFEYIKIEYSGGGDSGCIDDVLLLFNDTVTIEDGEVSKNNDRDYGTPDAVLKELIEEKATTHVLNKADDWWNNEGGGGTLYISTMDGSYHGHHYVNYSETIDSTLTGKFGDE